MSDNSAIEWTDATWNPVTGCTKVSPGCKHCYAERMAKRLQGMGAPNYDNGFRVTLQPHMLERPLAWRKPRRVFVNSMSDLFHEAVPTAYIQRVLNVIRRAGQHTFQVLTKRAERLAQISPMIDWPGNLWMGVSVENQEYTDRIDLLRSTDACVKFLSLEPLIGPIVGLDLESIDWVIVGGESGPRARPIEKRWVLDLRDECHRARVPFFFKQWGGRSKKATGRKLDGRTYDEFPPGHAVVRSCQL